MISNVSLLLEKVALVWVHHPVYSKHWMYPAFDGALLQLRSVCYLMMSRWSESATWWCRAGQSPLLEDVTLVSQLPEDVTLVSQLLEDVVLLSPLLEDVVLVRVQVHEDVALVRIQLPEDVALVSQLLEDVVLVRSESRYMRMSRWSVSYLTMSYWSESSRPTTADVSRPTVNEPSIDGALLP